MTIHERVRTQPRLHRRTVSALPGRSHLGQRGLAGVLQGLPTRSDRRHLDTRSRPTAKTRPPPATAKAPPPRAEPLRGAAARIVQNMEASLEVPTATSVRTIPVKLLEENRRIVNRHQAMVAGSRISFTHLIGWAIVRALAAHPRMNARFEQIDGQPHLVPSTRSTSAWRSTFPRMANGCCSCPT